MFSSFIQNKETARVDPPARKGSLSASASQTNLAQSNALTQTDGNMGRQVSQYVHKDPTEVILRGFKANHGYAAIREYERIGGRICEDYAREAGAEQRKYKSDLRDQSSYRQRTLTKEEKLRVNRAAMGQHWIKVTFESAEAASLAIESSPQTIHGYIVHAEIYRGVGPAVDEAIPSNVFGASQYDLVGEQGSPRRRASRSQPRPFGTPGGGSMLDFASLSPPDSHTSSNTLDTNTLSHQSSATASSATVTGFSTSYSQPQPQDLSKSTTESAYCAKIPTAKRIQLLPPEQALLPQKSPWSRFVSSIPVVGWFTGDIIGSQVPRTELGDFDWQRASFYWRFMWYVDYYTGALDIVGGGEKED